MLAGMSVEHHTRIEKGKVGAISEDGLYAIARALQLDDAETAYLLDFVTEARRGRTLRANHAARAADEVPEGVLRFVDAVQGAAAVVTNARLDVVAANELGRAMYSLAFESDTCQRGVRAPVGASRRAHPCLGDEARQPPSGGAAGAGLQRAALCTRRLAHAHGLHGGSGEVAAERLSAVRGVGPRGGGNAAIWF